MIKFDIPTVTEIEQALDLPQDRWAKQCHSTSLALVRSGLLPEEARVARGHTPGVISQHSWAVLGDPYDPKAMVVDITLWSYVPSAPIVYVGRASDRPHVPHGSGSIWAWGRPPEPVSEVVELAVDPGRWANEFLHLAAPDGLDQRGWAFLAHAPVEGWPAKDIITAMVATPGLAALLPIDIVGMITDLNPNNLYF